MKILLFVSITSFIWMYYKSSMHLGEYYRMEQGEFRASLAADAKSEASLTSALEKVVRDKPKH